MRNDSEAIAISGNDDTLRIPPFAIERIMKALGISSVTKITGWTQDTYIDTAGNRIEKYSYPWVQGPDTAICSNGAKPTDAQIQEAIRNTRLGNATADGNKTRYDFNSATSPLEHMCNAAAKKLPGLAM